MTGSARIRVCYLSTLAHDNSTATWLPRPSDTACSQITVSDRVQCFSWYYSKVGVASRRLQCALYSALPVLTAPCSCSPAAADVIVGSNNKILFIPTSQRTINAQLRLAGLTITDVATFPGRLCPTTAVRWFDRQLPVSWSESPLLNSAHAINTLTTHLIVNPHRQTPHNSTANLRRVGVGRCEQDYLECVQAPADCRRFSSQRQTCCNLTVELRHVWQCELGITLTLQSAVREMAPNTLPVVFLYWCSPEII